jgi:lipopolysaccharide transport system ATP-binding protein
MKPENSNMDAIVADHVSKRFRKYSTRQRVALKEVILHPGRLRRAAMDPAQQLTALNDITFTIPQGLTVGIIGPNGSGKTTLLKLISGIYRPDSGRLQVYGKLSSLLGLGVGFHPELTGRENIFINGMILGLNRRELKSLYPSIVEFSGLKEFIDAPVRTYSSGMHVRLAFSIAVSLSPDILLLDEVLAVGDADFQKKCRQRMEDFQRSGKTILLVTHDLATAETWCERLLLLQRGRVVADGNPSEVVRYYLDQIVNQPDVPSGLT